MRRSKSSSNIPLPVFGRTLSSENLRNSQVGLKRTNSSNNLAPPRPSHRSSSKHHEPRNSQLGSACKPGSSKRATATPMRMGNMCPRSPGMQLTTQKINDKNYSGEQFRKVCSFLEQRMDNFEPQYVKSLTLNSFVNILTLLFKEIDPRININMENHKEIAIKYLKLYRYPAQVTVSMLKSANTSLSWAPVMSIFGWLVDIINKSNEEDFEEDDLKQYMVNRFNKFFRAEAQMPENFIDKITGFDRKKNDALEAEVKELRIKKKSVEEYLAEKQKIEEERIKHFDQMIGDIKEFKEGKLEIKLKHKIKQLTAENEMKEAKIADLRLALNKITDTINNQKYSLKDKQALLKELEDKQFTLNLKKTELENVLKLKYEYDTKQTDHRREIENEIHKINGRLLQLNLVSLGDDTKKIQLPDRGFHQTEFLQIVEEKRRLLQNIEEKINSKLNQAKETFTTVETELGITNDCLNKLCKENSNLKNKIENLKNDKERIVFEANTLSKQIEKKIASLKVVDIKALEKQEIDLKKELSELEEKIEEYKVFCLTAFKEILEKAKESAKELYSIMDDMSDVAKNKYAELVKRRETELEVIFKHLNFEA